MRKLSKSMRRRRRQLLRAAGAPLRTRVAAGAGLGLFMALAGLAVGVLRGAVAFASGHAVGIAPREWLIVPVYLVAWVVSGVVGGLLWPMNRSWPGRLVLALLLGYLFMLAPILLISGSPSRWGDEGWTVYAMCGVYGAVIAFVILRPERSAA